MRDDPGLDLGAIAACLAANYGVCVASMAYLPIGYDYAAFVYRVVAEDGAVWFLKIRSGPVFEPGLAVPAALTEAGVPNVLAPLRTRAGDLWCRLGDFAAILYPFVPGENAMDAGLDDGQWRTFGATLRAVHDSGLHGRFRDRLAAETFALPSAAVAREVGAVVEAGGFAGAAARFAAAWRDHAARIEWVLARAGALGRELAARSWDPVLCHADIHAANLLVGADGRIYLVDWDGPKIAPRERDLLFVVGSTIARVVEPREEALFFAGYGPVAVDPVCLAFYRYERVIEDIGEFGKTILLDPTLSEDARAAAAELAIGNLAPGGPIEAAETVLQTWSAG